ncbi:MAG: LLM class F420-dependent oxidoreductase [Egibacteraceae bacterium]
MQLAVSLPVAGVGVDATVPFVRRCVEWGYSAAWSSEVAGPDFPSLLGAVASCGVDLGVAVAPVQTRSPWLLAATASTLSHLSGGRFTLGLGTSSEVIVEQWSGIPFERPLERLRETVEAVRAILSGQRVDLSGEFVTARGYRLFAPPPAPVPIVVGALNRRSLRQAGAIADGVCLNQLAPEHVPLVLAEARAGAEAAGRDPSGLLVVARLLCWVTDDVPAAREQARRTLVPYIATSVYHRFYRWLGFGEEAEAVRVALGGRDRKAATAAVSDRLLDAVTAIGDEEFVTAKVQAYVDAGVAVPVIACLCPDAVAAERTLRGIAARLRTAR